MAPAPAPHGAQTLTATPDAFLAACRADMQRARGEIARLKALPAPRDTFAALSAYDGAMSPLVATASVRPEERKTPPCWSTRYGCKP